MGSQRQDGASQGRGAGRELDAAIAERVMGESQPIETHADSLDRQLGGYVYRSSGGAWLELCSYDTGDVPTWDPRPYSTEIAAAWEVVEAMRARGYRVTVADAAEPGHWYARFEGESRLSASVAATAPLAICLACLAVVESRAAPPEPASVAATSPSLEVP